MSSFDKDVRAQQGKCHYCKCNLTARGLSNPTTATVDHYRPKAILGHKDGVDGNETVIACARCNGIKGATPPEVFLRYIELFGIAGLGNHRAYRVFCYRLMAAGLRFKAVETEMLEEFAWMAAVTTRMKAS